MIIPGFTVNEPDHKHDFGLWMFEKQDSIFPICTACHEMNYSRPTKYCPVCGAMMLNAGDALAHYKTQCPPFESKAVNDE